MIEKIKQQKLNLSMILFFILLSIYPSIIFDTVSETIKFRFGTLIAISTVFWIMNLFCIKEVTNKIKNSKVTFLFLILFIACVAMSTIFSQYQTDSWFGLSYRRTGFVTYICLMILFMNSFLFANKDKNNLEEMLRIVVLSSTIISFVGLLQFFGVDIIRHNHDLFINHKSYSTVIHSNHLGTFLVMIFPISIYFVIKKQNFYSYLSFSLIYADILTTQCRGAWVGVIVGLIWLFLWGIIKYRQLIMRLFFIIIVITLILTPMYDFSILRQANSFQKEATLTLQNDEMAGSFRLGIWKECFKKLKELPIIGVGPDCLKYIAPERFTELQGPNWPAKAHNIYLEIAVTMGIPALIFYIGFLGSIIKNTNKNDDLQQMFFMMILIYLVQGIFLVDVLSVYPIFFVLLGFYLGVKEKNKTLIT